MGHIFLPTVTHRWVRTQRETTNLLFLKTVLIFIPTFQQRVTKQAQTCLCVVPQSTSDHNNDFWYTLSLYGHKLVAKMGWYELKCASCSGTVHLYRLHRYCINTEQCSSKSHRMFGHDHHYFLQCPQSTSIWSIIIANIVSRLILKVYNNTDHHYCTCETLKKIV